MCETHVITDYTMKPFVIFLCHSPRCVSSKRPMNTSRSGRSAAVASVWRAPLVATSLIFCTSAGYCSLGYSVPGTSRSVQFASSKLFVPKCVSHNASFVCCNAVWCVLAGRLPQTSTRPARCCACRTGCRRSPRFRRSPCLPLPLPTYTRSSGQCLRPEVAHRPQTRSSCPALRS